MIEVKNLSLAYGSKAILKQVSFQIEAGEVVGLVGPNGAGKTTLLSALTGLLPYSEGQVKVAGLYMPAGKALYR